DRVPIWIPKTASRCHVERVAILRSTSKCASRATDGPFMRASERLASAIGMKSQDSLRGMRRDIDSSGLAESEIIRAQLFRGHFHWSGASVGGNLRSDDQILVRYGNPDPAVMQLDSVGTWRLRRLRAQAILLKPDAPAFLLLIDREN